MLVVTHIFLVICTKYGCVLISSLVEIICHMGVGVYSMVFGGGEEDCMEIFLCVAKGVVIVVVYDHCYGTVVFFGNHFGPVDGFHGKFMIWKVG